MDPRELPATDRQRYRDARSRVFAARDRGEITDEELSAWLDRLPNAPAVTRERPVLALVLRGINALLDRVT